MTSVRTRGTRRPALVGAVLALLGALVVAPGTAQAATSTYAADNSIFPNPERGFHHRVDIMALSAADVQSARSTNSITSAADPLQCPAHRRDLPLSLVCTWYADIGRQDWMTMYRGGPGKPL